MIARFSFVALAALMPVLSSASADLASWRVTDAGVEEAGLRALSGADGVTELTSAGDARCLGMKAGTNPASAYLYFDVDLSLSLPDKTPLCLVVEYFDGGLGGRLSLHYDSATGDSQEAKYRASEQLWGGWLTGRKAWHTAIFALEQPAFKNRQNLGADFRFTGSTLLVRSVKLVTELPDNADEVDTMDTTDFERLVSIGHGGQLIIGGFDPGRKEDVRRLTQELEGSIPALKALGVTSHEGYVRWNLCELAPGEYDWSVYDAFVDVYRKYDLKWVPFLIIGSAYSLPDWYYKQEGSQGYVCLKHGETSDVESLWNPVLRDHVARFIKAFCEHYRDKDVIESILLGVTGNYGEAIYVVTGNDWTASIHGEYHTHPGFWAGDPYARQSFRDWLVAKYTTAEALNAAWGTEYGSVGAVEPFLQDAAPNDRAWLDMCDWYIGSMTDWSRFWMSETRKHFPDGDINLCTGGHAPPEHGANFGDQCKVAAEIGGGVRITNEASDIKANFSLTRWVASAGQQYGAYYSFEPAGMVNEPGVIARIYNATASGAKGLHYYFPNLFGTDGARNNFVKWGGQFRQRTPVVEIAVYYPQTHIKLNGNKFLGKVQPLRDRFDFGYMSDEQIRDGGLVRVKALILMDGNVSEGAVWAAVTDWVRNGGVVLYADGMGRLRTVEGDEACHDALLGKEADHGKGRVETFAGDPDTVEYRAFLAEKLAQAEELLPATRAMAALDGEEDGVFVTVCAPNELLWLNYTDQPVQKQGQEIAAYSITSQEAP
jgi:Glycosyl hydrolase family 14